MSTISVDLRYFLLSMLTACTFPGEHALNIELCELSKNPTFRCSGHKIASAERFGLLLNYILCLRLFDLLTPEVVQGSAMV